jgi:hypothetical protein
LKIEYLLEKIKIIEKYTFDKESKANGVPIKSLINFIKKLK